MGYGYVTLQRIGRAPIKISILATALHPACSHQRLRLEGMSCISTSLHSGDTRRQSCSPCAWDGESLLTVDTGLRHRLQATETKFGCPTARHLWLALSNKPQRRPQTLQLNRKAACFIYACFAHQVRETTDRAFFDRIKDASREKGTSWPLHFQ